MALVPVYGTMRHMSEDIQASGRIIEYNGGKLKPISHANAREMQAKSAESRRNKAAQAARNKTLARLAASDPTIGNVYDAWGSLVADQAEALRQAASEGKPRADDMMQVGRAMGMVAQVGERGHSDSVTASVSIPASVARDILASMAGRQVIDAEVVEAEEAGEGGGGG